MEFFGVYRNSDSAIYPADSKARLFEDSSQLTKAHASHAEINELGEVDFRLATETGKTFYFSTSDNSDPRSNGRNYVIRDELHFRTTQKVTILVLISLIAGTILYSRISALIRRKDFLLAVSAILCLILTRWIHGPFFWPLVSSSIILQILAIREFLPATKGSKFTKSELTVNSIIAVSATGFILFTIETGLFAFEIYATSYSATNQTEIKIDEELELVIPREKVDYIKKRRRLLTLPKDWESRIVEVPDINMPSAGMMFYTYMTNMGFVDMQKTFQQKNQMFSG